MLLIDRKYCLPRYKNHTITIKKDIQLFCNGACPVTILRKKAVIPFSETKVGFAFEYGYTAYVNEIVTGLVGNNL